MDMGVNGLARHAFLPNTSTVQPPELYRSKKLVCSTYQCETRKHRSTSEHAERSGPPRMLQGFSRPAPLRLRSWSTNGSQLDIHYRIISITMQRKNGLPRGDLVRSLSGALTHANFGLPIGNTDRLGVLNVPGSNGLRFHDCKCKIWWSPVER